MRIVRLFYFLALAALAAAPAPARANTSDQEELVMRARYSIERLLASNAIKEGTALIDRARAIMIFPSLLKGAFLVGGEGGSGVLLGRHADGSWSYPAFYTLGSMSIGLQIGGQSSEAVLLIMTEEALKSLMEDQVKLGGDLSIAAGPIGSGIEAASATSLTADIYTYSTTKGLFAGAALEGAIIARREDWNGEFYDGIVSPEAIVLNGEAQNAKADPLREELRMLISGS